MNEKIKLSKSKKLSKRDSKESGIADDGSKESHRVKKSMKPSEPSSKRESKILGETKRDEMMTTANGLRSRLTL
jgi:hypothetical protein